LAYCDRLKGEIESQSYDGAPVAAKIDDRDLRGGEKSWQHVKRGVPIRLEVGPRDVAGDSVFMARRDRSPKEKSGVKREEFLASLPATLDEMQRGLFERAAAMRADATRTIDRLDEFTEYFTPKNAEQPEIHGGFALCHWSEDPAVEETLKNLKVTIRCIPVDGDDEPGKCIFTGQPSKKRAVFAKAY
jgi:prolyl-tRNA synthetase